MMTISLPADLEARLAEEAGRRGMTVEELALEQLRRTLPKLPKGGPLPSSGETMFDYLRDYIGVLDGSEDLSQDTARKFADDLEMDYRRQQEEFVHRKGSS